MKYREIVNTHKISREIMDRKLEKGHVCVDATLGNGHDSLYLAEKIGEEGKLYAFDIQEIALETSRKRLEKDGLAANTIFIHDGHENLDKYVKEPVDLFIYNLGYLPRGDKDIRTKKSTTRESLEKALKLLEKNGIILITCYTGHDGGMEEKNAVEELLRNLDQNFFNVLKYDFINQKNFPPILYSLEKMGGDKICLK